MHSPPAGMRPGTRHVMPWGASEWHHGDISGIQRGACLMHGSAPQAACVSSGAGADRIRTASQAAVCECVRELALRHALHCRADAQVAHRLCNTEICSCIHT